MPSKERVEDLIAHVGRGDIEEAIEEFYAEDVEMRENKSAPIIGRADNLEREREFFGSIEVHEHRAVGYAIDGDRVAIDWIFDYSLADGTRIRMEQVAFQTWAGDRIVKERFYYDSASLAA